MTLPSSLNMKGSSSSRVTKWRIDAFLCSAFLLLCIVAVHPGVEIGMIDDFSYFKSAQVLASTGHVVYNGWAAAMLGWQLYLGALFIKLFGASYTAVRASTTIIALVMVFLVQRIYLRLGINSWNASMGTLTLVACPLFMPLSVSFLSDIDGLFCIVLCLYACLRALQAPANRSALGWLVFAAVTGAVGGTVRQSSWVGVLVIFPCTVWLLRRRPHVLLLGGTLYAVSLAFVFASMNWFLRQPYVIFDGLPTRLRPGIVSHALSQSFGAIFTLVMFLLPILAAFAFALFLSRSRNYRWLALRGNRFRNRHSHSGHTISSGSFVSSFPRGLYKQVRASRKRSFTWRVSSDLGTRYAALSLWGHLRPAFLLPHLAPNGLSSFTRVR